MDYLGKSVLFIASALLSLTAYSAPTYFATDLGTLYEGESSIIIGLNAQGVGVGWNNGVPITGGLTGALFKDGQVTDLGGLDGGGVQRLTQALSINSSGVIVGASRLSNESTSHAFIYKNGVMTDLTPEFSGYSFAAAINESGVIVGAIGSTAVKWNDGIPTALGFYQAYAINNLGWIAGISIVGGPAVLDKDGVVTYLGPADAGLIGYGINDFGDVVGYGQFGWLYTRDGRFTSLEMMAYKINNGGQIVGSANGAGMLLDGGVYYDLNSHIINPSEWTIVTTTSINDAGQIAALGYNGSIYRAFRLDPVSDVPVPGTLALLSLGLVGICAARRKRF